MAAEFICTVVEKQASKADTVTIALAGGKTPERLYQNLARPPFHARMPWPKIHFFWGDERCVSFDHPDSNFGMAFRTMISKSPVPPQNVHPMPGDMLFPNKAAATYEKILRGFFNPSPLGDGQGATPTQGSRYPSFDLILLGLGKDGHTASLFPGDGILEEENRWVAAVNNPRGSPPVPRITLTLPVINRAKTVIFLVSGVEKRDVIRSILDDSEWAGRFYPAAMVRPEGKVLWFLDEDAAGRAPGPRPHQ